MNQRFSWPVRPVACACNTVQGEHYRITVLTPALLRLEYAPNGCFEDRASQCVFYRDFSACAYEKTIVDGVLRIQTQALELTYQENMPFDRQSLSIRLLQEPASCWHFGEDFEDLGGTTKTLDEVEGSCPLGRGIISRNGFSVLDDSSTLVLEPDGWIGVRAEGTLDMYFFGYGFRYLQALQDFYRLTGNPPMLPAYALGNWWSRYHAYTQQEYCELVEKFHREDIPFSVSVVDMDWHLVQIPEDKDTVRPCAPQPWCDHPGWTGYTWNEALFPDYKAFLKFLKKHHLHTALNLHPHDGVRSHERMYAEMAVRCGVDPKSRQRIPFNILSREYMAQYFDLLHHPYEADGVDFWWMDWQQGTDYWWIHEPNKPGQYQDPRERLDPLWMLNHLHILDISRDGKRPMFFSRYAGPGSHRYPVGFSGDTLATWRSLQFQPEFTATASNIGYTWWSHDIGGHMGGDRDDELAVRWLQLGVFSPVNRLHSSNNPYQSKEPDCYGSQAEEIMKHWLRLRHRMFPYLYTMNNRSHTQGIPLVLPMYYSYPKCQNAYKVPNQYLFGSELMVAPITQKADPYSLHGQVTAWLPEGDWFDFFTGLHYMGGRMMDLHRTLDTAPVLAKAGGIVPMAVFQKQDNRLYNAEEMEVTVFPGDSNSFTLYEDGGDGSQYRQGAYAVTDMALQWAEEAVFTIQPARGDLSLIPQSRRWRICLRGFHRDASVSVNIPGAVITRDDKSNTTVVELTAEVTQEVTVRITGIVLIHDNADAMDRCKDILLKSQLNYGEKQQITQMLERNDSAYRRLYTLYFRSTHLHPTLDALRELLTLTERYR